MDIMSIETNPQDSLAMVTVCAHVPVGDYYVEALAVFSFSGEMRSGTVCGRVLDDGTVVPIEHDVAARVVDLLEDGTREAAIDAIDKLQLHVDGP